MCEKFYQNITGYYKENIKRKDSAFWNEGKWNNFIAPFLPNDCSEMVFIEIGCNNGLFLKLAKDKGFNKVIGIDSHKGAVERGLEYRTAIGYDYQLSCQAVGEGFSLKGLPVADYVLLSNVHYYFELSAWIALLDELATKTCHCIVISRPKEKGHWIPRSDYAGVCHYFAGWEHVNQIAGIKGNGDPSPREDMFSVLFKNKHLERKQIADLDFGNIGQGRRGQRYEIIKDIMFKRDGKLGKLEDTMFYKSIADRVKNKWDAGRIFNHVMKKVLMMWDVMDNGLKEAVLIHPDNRLSDGGHRTAVIANLGYKSIITRTI